MAQNVHLKITGIPGDVDGEWITVQSFFHSIARWDEDRYSTPNKDFGITKFFDAASPLLALACSEGWRIGEAMLRVGTNDTDRPRVLEIRLFDVLISSYQISGGQHAGLEPPCETLNLRFEKIEWVYFPSATALPEAQRTVKTGWTSADYQEPARSC